MALATCIAIAMSYCSGNPSVKWQEEVRMENGEMLLVDRKAKGKIDKGEQSDPKMWTITKMSFKVQQMPANWTAPPVWHSEKHIPIFLDYHPQERTWSVVVTFMHPGWALLGRPDLSCIEYQSKNGGPWQVIPLEKRLIGRKNNMLVIPNHKGEPKLVTEEERDRRNSRPDGTFRTIAPVWNR